MSDRDKSTGAFGSDVTYDSSTLAALPRAIFYGSVLAAVHALAILIGFDSSTRLAGAVAAVLFLSVLGTTVAMAVYGYRQRHYEFGQHSITERRWMLQPVETQLAYADIEDITVTQSRLQSLFGAATVRLNHIESDTVGDEEAMRIRHVADPGAVHSELISRCAEFHEAVPRQEVAHSFENYSVEDASVFTGQNAATVTGGTYLLPYAVVEPRIRSILRAFSVHGLSLVTILSVPLVYVLAVNQLVTLPRLVVLWLSLFVGYLCYGLWTRGRVTHELYSEYLKIIEGGEIKTVGYDDIATVECISGGRLHGSAEKVVGRDDDGSTVVEIPYVYNGESLADGLAEVAKARQE